MTPERKKDSARKGEAGALTQLELGLKPNEPSNIAEKELQARGRPQAATEETSRSREEIEGERRRLYEECVDYLVDLSDTAIVLWGIRLWRSGTKTDPSEPARASFDSLAKRIGGANSADTKAQRSRVIAAARELETRNPPLIHRERNGDGPGTPYLWRLLSPPEPGEAPAHPDAYERTRKIFQRNRPVPAADRAAAFRLLAQLSSDEDHELARKELCQLLRIRSWPTARKRLEGLKAAMPGFRWEEGWERGRSVVALRVPISETPKQRQERLNRLRAEWRSLLSELEELGLGDLALEVIKLADKHVTSKRGTSPERKVKDLRHIRDRAKELNHAPLMRYALEETLRGPALRQPKNSRWWKYLDAVLNNPRNKAKFLGRGSSTNGNWTKSDDDRRRREQEIAQLLREASELAGGPDRDDPEVRRRCLALHEEILSRTEDVADEFDGDDAGSRQAAARRSLLIALKEGLSYFRRSPGEVLEPNPYGLDLWPELDPDDEHWPATAKSVASSTAVSSA